MRWIDLHSRGRRWAAMGTLAGLTLAGALTAILLSSCRGDRQPRVSEEPLTVQGVPRVRVLLSSVVTEAVATTTGGYRITLDGEMLTESHQRLDRARIVRFGGAWRVNALSGAGKDLAILPYEGSLVRFAGTLYRGRLRLFSVGPDTFRVVNDVDLESYLAGVLPKEIYAHWSPETFKALAVAARTYALYHMRKPGAARRAFDVFSTAASQVYGGFSAETEKSWQAVRQTHAIVLAHGPAGDEQIFPAYYSACNGGYVNGVEVLNDGPIIPPLLGGQKDPDNVKCPRYIWPAVRISKRDMLTALKRNYPSAGELRAIREIRVVKVTPYGRAVWVDVVSPDRKSIRIRAEDLRLALLRSGPPAAKKLYSMNCRIRDLGDEIEFRDGKGFGHGVGLSQWGAQGKAERGMTAEQILSFYYPGARFFRAY